MTARTVALVRDYTGTALMVTAILLSTAADTVGQLADRLIGDGQ